MMRKTTAFSFYIFTLVCCTPLYANPDKELLEQYQRLETELEKSIFGEPILLFSTIGKNYAQGEVYAVLDAPFTSLQQILSTPAKWCELAILHINNKACIYERDVVTFFVGRKHYQTPDDAFALRYQFKQQTSSQHQLNIKLSAEKGALNTSNYLINLEAVAIDEHKSFIRFTYRYQFGLMAEIAINTYLSTIGRSKVGFTIVGRDENSEPIYIKGQQGIVERNVMRYIFAIQAALDARKSATGDRAGAGFDHWYTRIEKHPLQLMELSRDEYINNKRRELKNQHTIQKSLPQ